MSDYDGVFFMLGFFTLAIGVSYFFSFDVPSQIKYDPFCESQGFDSLRYYSEIWVSENSIVCERDVMYKGEFVELETKRFSVYDYADWRNK